MAYWDIVICIPLMHILWYKSFDQQHSLQPYWVIPPNCLTLKELTFDLKSSLPLPVRLKVLRVWINPIVGASDPHKSRVLRSDGEFAFRLWSPHTSSCLRFDSNYSWTFDLKRLYSVGTCRSSHKTERRQRSFDNSGNSGPCRRMGCLYVPMIL